MTEDEFITKVKSHNPLIKEKVEQGSEFSVVFSKEYERELSSGGASRESQVVVRVSDDIRDIIKASQDKIYLGCRSHKVNDRFYIKSCSACHRFGHYHANCSNGPICGYCCSEDHDSSLCPLKQDKDHDHYKCINCEEAGKDGSGHSSHWPKCPTYLELQNKMKKNIPYYSKNEK